MAARKPFLFMDVDGVLNPDVHPRDYNNLKSKHRRWFDEQGYVMHQIRVDHTVYPVLVNPVHGDWIRELESVFEVVWATTWEFEANRKLSPLLGVPTTYKVVRFYPNVETYRDKFHFDNRGSRASWKTHRLVEWANGNPFYWFDDEANRFTQNLVKSFSDVPGVAKHVPPTRGLVREHVDEALTWAKGL